MGWVGLGDVKMDPCPSLIAPDLSDKPVGDAFQIVAEVRSGEVAYSDAVVDVESGGEEIAAPLDEAEHVKLVGGRKQPFHVVGRHLRVASVRVVDDETHHVRRHARYKDLRAVIHGMAPKNRRSLTENNYS